MSEDTAEYSIDQLAAHTRVPSRTIRFYQSKGALQKPEIRGRKAFYNDTHVARLALIGTLQDRGLRIRAIRDLVQRIDRGELDLDAWLGLEDQLHAPVGDGGPKLYSEDDLATLLHDCRPGMRADLLRHGLLERRADAFFAASDSLLQTTLKMQAAGIEIEVAQQAAQITRKHLSKLAASLGKHYLHHAGTGFGRSPSTEDLSEAFGALHPLGQRVLHTIFEQEMSQVLRAYADSGKIASIATTKN